jgi:hypothetical protein
VQEITLERRETVEMIDVKDMILIYEGVHYKTYCDNVDHWIVGTSGIPVKAEKHALYNHNKQL